MCPLARHPYCNADPRLPDLHYGLIAWLVDIVISDQFLVLSTILTLILALVKLAIYFCSACPFISFSMSLNTLKALIFTGTNFRWNLFSREIIFAISNFDYFARTYFHEFCEFLNFEVLLSPLKFSLFHWNLVDNFQKYIGLLNISYFTVTTSLSGKFREFLIFRIFCGNKFLQISRFLSKSRK